jgi:hypothetical protein
LIIGILLNIDASKIKSGIINKKGIKGILYLTIAPVTVVVIPIKIKEVITITMQQINKFLSIGILSLNKSKGKK